ncbi:endonuclease [Flammeovirga sp. EKP202]|uniref:endonuclease n=1 Tax=Flammeovirga sp. EKP202 TaxID=2770592 RepID=UPI00165F3D27|nr:endonuclease [Flammeovirga sp. EKP202]MBD0405112.1 endonuclease [Flammeovirga sp. EKP202]
MKKNNLQFLLLLSLLSISIWSCEKEDQENIEIPEEDENVVARINEKFFGTQYNQIEIEGWTNYKEEGRGGFQYQSHYSNPSYANITVFKTGEERRTWLITPKLDVRNAEDKTFSFDSRQEYDEGVVFKVMVSPDYDGEAAPEEYTWEELDVTLSKDGASGYGSWVNSGKIDLTSYGNVSVAFYYEGDERIVSGGYSIDNFVFNDDGKEEPVDPSDYYKNAEGLDGYELKSTLATITSTGHEWIDYGDLWTLYHTSDDKYQKSEIIWDMYSDIPDPENPTVPDGNQPNEYEYQITVDQCGQSGAGEGYCYNREHVMPQSWFDKKAPMVADAHHIVPTDAYVNTRRSNHPHGVVASHTWKSTNGSKLGSGTAASGYTGTVFEPIDEYKGDFARMYLYMATRYESQIGSWVNNGQAGTVLDGSSNKVYKDWFLNLMLEWHKNDPVSDKEIDRNEQIFQLQKNRNPFIDHPEYADMIWDNSVN